VRLGDGTQVRSAVVGVDERTDLAVVRADEGGLPTLELAEASGLGVGELWWRSATRWALSGAPASEW